MDNKIHKNIYFLFGIFGTVPSMSFKEDKIKFSRIRSIFLTPIVLINILALFNTPVFYSRYFETSWQSTLDVIYLIRAIIGDLYLRIPMICLIFYDIKDWKIFHYRYFCVMNYLPNLKRRQRFNISMIALFTFFQVLSASQITVFIYTIILLGSRNAFGIMDILSIVYSQHYAFNTILIGILYSFLLREIYTNINFHLLYITSKNWMNTEYTLSELVKIGKMYRIIKEMVDEFNTIYG